MKKTLFAGAAAVLAATLAGCVAVPVDGPAVYAAPPPPPVMVVRPAYYGHYHYRHGPRWRRW